MPATRCSSSSITGSNTTGASRCRIGSTTGFSRTAMAPAMPLSIIARLWRRSRRPLPPLEQRGIADPVAGLDAVLPGSPPDHLQHRPDRPARRNDVLGLGLGVLGDP